MPEVTIAIIAFNEERRIRDCLSGAKWANQLLVIDGYSTDQTANIAREFTEDVILSDRLSPANPGGFADQRNFAMECSTSDWVFFLDADEKITPALAEEIQTLLREGIAEDISAFRVRRKEHFFGVYTPYTHGESWLIRLMRKDRAKWNTRLVHEGLEIQGRIGDLDGYLLHYSKDSISDYLATQNRYTSLEAEQALREGKPLDPSPFRLMIKTFLNLYIYKKSYREGAFGLIMSLLFAQYSFLCWAKRWEIEMKAGRVTSSDPHSKTLRAIAKFLSQIWNRISPPKSE